MKTQKIIVTLTTVALTTWLVGCKQETNTAADATKEGAAKTETAVDQANDAVKKTVETAKETGAKVVEDVKAAGVQAVEDVKAASAQAVASVTEKAKEVAAPASAKAQELIDSAKSLFTEGKFADALAKLNQTSDASPSTEQQSVVDSLKVQIEKAIAAAAKMTTDATKSATNALNNLFQK